jgi:hypothetical protein
MAQAHLIDNTIPVELRPNAILAIVKILEPCCSYFKTRPDVSCIFRCPDLNKLVGGVSTSQHTKAQAVDFTIVGVTLIQIADYIRHNLEFDQLILEQINTVKWCHCSYSSVKNRKEVLKFNGIKYVSI